MASTSDKALGLSFLDVLSCALGAAIVLAVIFSVIRNPPTSPIPNEFILVEIKVVIEGGDPDMDFVTVVNPPGQVPRIAVESSGVGASNQGGNFLSWKGHSEDNKTHYIYLSVKDPIAGRYEFEPLVADVGTSGHKLTSRSVRIWKADGPMTFDPETVMGSFDLPRAGLAPTLPATIFPVEIGR